MGYPTGGGPYFIFKFCLFFKSITFYRNGIDRTPCFVEKSTALRFRAVSVGLRSRGHK